MAGLTLKAAVVIGIDFESPQVQFVRVEVEGRPARAVNYPALGDRVSLGQRVLVNTTSVELSLGSGGYHFILPAGGSLSSGWGHQMKLRYTPLQLRVNCAEEQDSPWHGLFQDAGGLEGIPVLAAELHSMAPPLALGIRHLDPEARIAYVLTEGGALPAGFSNNIRTLKEAGVVAAVISSGHSFGGDIETLNIFTGLQAAARVAEADYIIAAMGPGIAGTGTVYGFSGLEQGFVLQAAYALGGLPLLVPRIGFCDPRPRHRGISHHTLTILTRAYLGPAWIPLPLLPLSRRSLLLEQVRRLPGRYWLHWREGSFIAGLARSQEELFSSMGRSYRENPEFFIALGAAARLAVELYRSKRRLRRIAIK